MHDLRVFYAHFHGAALAARVVVVDGVRKTVTLAVGLSIELLWQDHIGVLTVDVAGNVKGMPEEIAVTTFQAVAFDGDVSEGRVVRMRRRIGHRTTRV